MRSSERNPEHILPSRDHRDMTLSMSTLAPSSFRRLVIALFVCVAGGCLHSEQELTFHEANVQTVSRMQGPVSVSGRVQDDSGRPLSGVTVTYLCDYLVAGYQPNPQDEWDRGTKKVGGDFKLSWSSAKFVKLSFSKPGYTEEQLLVASSESAEGRALPGAIVSPATNVVITLARSPQ
jgi:hypothetical protein